MTQLTVMTNHIRNHDDN